ncbi:MAG: hypothetical protein K9M82_09230 [Deltaproteobacteria bacterium]|nr:hypothetical protein [Deltaproteobacteria bacterium]
MDFKAHLETAWTLTLRYIAPLILMTLAMGVVSFLSLGILAPVIMAGYMHSILLMIREGREPRVQDIFSQLRLFLPLFLFGLAVFFAIMIGFALLVLPGLAVALAVSFGCLYVLPLMTDKGMGLVEAVKESFRMSTGKSTLDQIVVMVLYLGLSAVGGSVFIGWLFTQPFATVFLLSVYEEKLTRPELS